jgi:nucleotide-binding universal stress UspA family protein
MASHGRKGLERVLLGSETRHVLARGSVPVLVLR